MGSDYQDVFADQLGRLRGVLDGLSDDDMLRASRCRGWAVCDVVAHLHLGLQEMLCGYVMTTDAPADSDLASYWRQLPPADDPPVDPPADDPPADPPADDPPVTQTRFVRILASAYSRPTRLVEHLRPTLDALAAVNGRARPGERVAFQGHVLRVGDFVATWVVELAVHHLDVTLELPDAAPPVPAALAVTRETLDALLPGLPATGWDDVTYVLKGTGRLPLTPAERDRLGATAEGFPALG